MQRLRCLVRKEFLELRMNPRLFGLVIIAPILQLTLLGYAATTDVKDVPLLVADGDRSAASRELVARFEASPNFTVIGTVTTVSEIEPVPRARHRGARPVDSGRLRRERAGRPAGQRAGGGRWHRLELDHGRARVCDQPDRRIRPGARRQQWSRVGIRGPRRASTPASASGSTRSSRAVTS